MTNTRYWLSSPATKIWFLFLVMTSAVTYTTTKYYNKKIPTRELDIAVVVKVLEQADKYCKGMKARTFTVRASGLVVDAGCSK